ncbi:MAG: hypothetical protein CSA26_09905 [Desulfobacterales bacterium]|nr:MAG: hypothetical protein CSA26_09905 [Desulfobacterales bacterium]
MVDSEKDIYAPVGHQNPKTGATLVVEQLTCQYDDKEVLHDINFSLEKGEVLCLLGPSGSGKTTLLRILAGLEKDYTGTICFSGEDIQNVAPHKRNFGMMFQEYALFPHKSVWENIAFGLEMQKCSPDEIRRKVVQMLKTVGLSGFENRNIDELSGGERQRVALARSLAPGPRLLLLDEPLGSLDRSLRERLIGEIRAILKSLSVTAVFVTHDQSEAFGIADKVAILQDGQLQQFDPPEQLYRTPANSRVARFLGFTNVVEGYFDDDLEFHSPIDIAKGNLRFAASGRKTIPRKNTGKSILIFRPDGARIVSAVQPEKRAEGIVLAGIITRRQFQGGSYKMSVVAGLPFSFDLPLEPAPPAVNEQIHLHLSPSSIICVDS